MADFISKYTGEEIEARLDRVPELETGKAPLWDSEKQYAKGDFCVHKGYLWVCTAETGNTGTEPSTNYNVWNVTYSNPNLLDNPWFTVNQRGWTSGTPSGANVYTVDRWKINDNTTLVKDDNGITITVGASVECLYQYLNMDLVKQIAGKVCTISVMLQTGEVFSKTITLPEDYNTYWDTSDILIGHFKFDIYGNPNLYGWVDFRMFNGVPGETISIRAVKIELGPVSTLANDTQPDYTTELLKCQRYFIRLEDGLTWFGRSNTNVQTSYAFPVKMRVSNPTIVLKNKVVSLRLNSAGASQPYNTENATIPGAVITDYGINWVELSGFSGIPVGSIGIGKVELEISADL